MSKPLVHVDTNVLLYCFDTRDPHKRAQAQAWIGACWARRCGRLSVQVLNEFYSNARKKFATAISAGDARAEVRRYQHWKPWQIDHATVETAWAIESRCGLSYWDALIVAAAQHQGCRYLLSEDLQHGLQIDGVQILDPFKTGPELLDEREPA
ncbi:MAG: PIN domain-containing protein [Pelomonas sp.]|nr:PIN domain-containing protein [Roseateles sp.]